MKKTLIAILFLALFAAGCSSTPKAEPLQNFASHIGTAHIEGEDVYFEHNGTYKVAKGQKEVFEEQPGPYMTVILMSDGSYIIQDNDKEITYDTAAREELKEKQEQAAEEQKQKEQEQRELEQQKKQEQIDFQREKQQKELDIEQQKLDDKQENKQRLLDIKEKIINAQINSSN